MMRTIIGRMAVVTDRHARRYPEAWGEFGIRIIYELYLGRYIPFIDTSPSRPTELLLGLDSAIRHQLPDLD